MPSDAPAKVPRDALVMPSPGVGFQNHLSELPHAFHQVCSTGTLGLHARRAAAASPKGRPARPCCASDRYPRKEKLPHHHRSSSAAQNPQRCVLVACTRSQTIVMFLKALQDSRKKVPTLSLALYPSERAIMIGRLLIEPSFTDDERVAAPSNEGHSCGTVCLACSLHLNLLSPSTPPGIRYKHVTALSWHRPEQV